MFVSRLIYLRVAGGGVHAVMKRQAGTNHITMHWDAEIAISNSFPQQEDGILSPKIYPEYPSLRYNIHNGLIYPIVG
jgi:hypothetical protein